VRRLSGSIGAEILAIDLAAEPGHNVIAEIRRAALKSPAMSVIWKTRLRFVCRVDCLRRRQPNRCWAHVMKAVNWSG
jgi:hypothetical protein